MLRVQLSDARLRLKGRVAYILYLEEGEHRGQATTQERRDERLLRKV
jgi:hypothetical protein